jgi:hypothetical protein
VLRRGQDEKIRLAFEKDKVTFLLREEVNGSSNKLTARLRE